MMRKERRWQILNLKILKQGSEIWNKWRNDNIGKYFDFSNTKLIGADLSNAKLRAVNLKKALLGGTKLNNADLSNANLNADLRDVNLFGATLINADLVNVKLIGATLANADLSNADFNNANLGGANLNSVNLRGADLSNADLSNASLTLANLFGAKLIGANLSNTNLFGTQLISANLTQADITGANLYGTSRDNWIINNINCDYVYWYDKERTPKNRDFKPGEFEELYNSLPAIEYYFEQGFTPIDAIIMNQVVLAINEKHPEFELKLDSFHSRGQPHVKFTVLHKEHTPVALEEIRHDYENRIRIIEGKKDQLLEVISMLASKPQIQANNIQSIIQTDKIANLNQQTYVEENMGDTINLKAGGDIAFGKDKAIVTINKTISDATGIPDDLQAKLRELTAAVEEMIKGMSDKDAKKVTTNLDILVNQAKEEEPQAALCQVSVNGLIEAAKAVGTIAQPVITTVQSIMKMLIF